VASYEWLLLSAWLLGAMVVSLRWSSQWRWLSTVERNATPMAAGREHEILRRVECAIGMAQQIKLASTTSAMEPGVIGIRNPVLLWPSQMSVRLSDAQIETIVAHEVFHVRRRDNLFASMHMFVTALFWFHPLVWWLGARIVEERELACDEHVLALGNRPDTYAQSIVKTCEFSIALPLVNVAAVTGADLKKRILRIMRNEPAAPLQFWKKASLVLGAVAAILLPLVLGAFVRAEAPVPTETPTVRQDAYRPDDSVETPKLIREVKPQYTPRAMEAKIQGAVLMECVVEPNGSVGRITVIQSLDPDLDQQAIAALQQWLFDPGTKEGEPVPVTVVIEIRFTLK
jgi:TonB family protein